MMIKGASHSLSLTHSTHTNSLREKKEQMLHKSQHARAMSDMMLQSVADRNKSFLV